MCGSELRSHAAVMTISVHEHSPSRPSWLRRCGMESLFLLSAFPVAIVSFTVLVTGLSVGIGLLITLVGIPILLLTLYAARGFAALERARLTWVADLSSSTPTYRKRSESALRSWLAVLGDRQLWLDLLHGVLVLPLATITWSITVAWWAAVFFGVPWPLFGHALDRANSKDSEDLSQLLGIHSYA